MAENWKVIPDFPDYAVSSHGRVKRVINSKSVNIRKAGSILKQGHTKTGYCHLTLCRNGEKHSKRIHQLVIKLFIGDPPSETHQCNHKDGNKDNNRADNLEWSTPSENTQHAYDNGLANAAKGSKSGPSKLTEKQVLKIREIAQKRNIPQREIAEQFGVCQQTISRAINRVDWRHI